MITQTYRKMFKISEQAVNWNKIICLWTDASRGKNLKKDLGRFIIGTTICYSNDVTEWHTKKMLTQLAGAVEYTNCMSAEE